MSVKPEGFFVDIKTAYVFHHPVKANLNFNTNIYIYIINQVSDF